MSYNILLVDDDVNQAHIIEHIIQDKMHYSTRLVENGQQAIDILTGNSNDIDLVLLDLSMPGIGGVDVINAVKPVKPNLPIIVRTGYDDLDMAVEAMKAGAVDFVKKLDSADKLKHSIDKALRSSILHDEMELLKKSKSGRTSFDDIVGESPVIKEIIALGKKVAASDIPVLLEGESGSGKESMARAIHCASGRADKPFIAVNCGAIPENLVESILFGHEKGAFTGALYKTYGKFREADGGTIFLDEVGELTPDIQVKLLRVLQDGEIDPVGASKPIKVNVRVISATNRNLLDEVKNHKFREDLFYRLNVFPIHVPSLRKRNGDVAMLIKYFIDAFAVSEGKPIKGITSEAEAILCKYNWPGNIRQLKNIIFRAVVLCESGQLGVADFPQIAGGLDTEYQDQDKKMSDLMKSGGSGKYGVKNLTLQENDGHFRRMCDIEKEVIVAAMQHYQEHMSEIARRLGIGRSTLYRKMEEFNIPHGNGAVKDNI